MDNLEVRLRVCDFVNNQDDLQDLPAINEKDENHFKVTHSVKDDILSHQEVDRNFVIILMYLKTIADTLISNNKLLDVLDRDELQKVADALSNVELILNQLGDLENRYKSLTSNLEAYKIATDAELNKKLEAVKIVNGYDISGEGSVTIDISRSQWLAHQTAIKPSTLGSWAILKCKQSVKWDELYYGSQLTDFNDTAVLSGTWRCYGALSENMGLFLRVV